MDEISHLLEDLAETEGLAKAERSETNDVIRIYTDYGVHDGALSSELIGALSRWDGVLYKRGEILSGDYDFVLK